MNKVWWRLHAISKCWWGLHLCCRQTFNQKIQNTYISSQYNLFVEAYISCGKCGVVVILFSRFLCVPFRAFFLAPFLFQTISLFPSISFRWVKQKLKMDRKKVETKWKTTLTIKLRPFAYLSTAKQVYFFRHVSSHAQTKMHKE